jgi:hypothetical protein
MEQSDARGGWGTGHAWKSPPCAPPRTGATNWRRLTVSRGHGCNAPQGESKAVIEMLGTGAIVAACAEVLDAAGAAHNAILPATYSPSRPASTRGSRRSTTQISPSRIIGAVNAAHSPRLAWLCMPGVTTVGPSQGTASAKSPRDDRCRAARDSRRLGYHTDSGHRIGKGARWLT